MKPVLSKHFLLMIHNHYYQQRYIAVTDAVSGELPIRFSQSAIKSWNLSKQKAVNN